MSTPIHADELEFWQLALRYGTLQPGLHGGKHVQGASPRDLINSDLIEIVPKRAWYLLEKWTDQNLYSYGVTLDLGWIESCCPHCGWFGYTPNGADLGQVHAPTCPGRTTR